MPKGKFITFEGPEGCGKSTHLGLLEKYLSQKGHSVLAVREPGGTDVGEAIRQILLNPDHVEMVDITEVFLYEAARAQLVNEVIIPALDAGNIVLCDRFSESTLAYQGYGGRMSVEWIQKIDHMARGGLLPDLTILLDIDPVEGLRRSQVRKVDQLDRMEKKGLEYHQRVRKGYLELAKQNPDRIRVLDGQDPIEVLQSKIREFVESIL